jgi:hypothetical protein
MLQAFIQHVYECVLNLIVDVGAEDKHVLRVPANRYCSSVLPLINSSLKERDTESLFVSEYKYFVDQTYNRF